MRSAALLAGGQLDAAEPLIEQGVDLARCNGFVTYELWGRLLRARLALARGQAFEARRLARELAAEARAKSLGGVAQGCAALLGR